MGSPRVSLIPLFALAGSLGGVLAGTVDAVRGGVEGLVWLFLCCFYGGAMALAFGGVGGVWYFLLRFTVLGQAGRGHGQVSLRALVPSGIVASLALSGALYGPALYCLQRFHHRMLIALLVGAIAFLLVPGMAGLGVLVYTGLLRMGLLRAGPQKPKREPIPLGIVLSCLALSALVFAGAVVGVLLYLQGRVRMTPALRALNLSLYVPVLSLVPFGVGAWLSRYLGRSLGRGALGHFAGTTLGAGLLPILVVGLPVLLFALGYRETLLLLDLRAVTALGIAGLGTLAVLLLGAQSGRGRVFRKPVPVFIAAGLWVVGLLSLSHGLGEAERLRKKALSVAPLSSAMLSGMQAACDLDRDGYPCRFVVGGSDCNDLDGAIHPGAFDWPGDGVDQNCNGHEATLEGPQRAPFPAMPNEVPSKQNLVLITVDALRADHLSAYGYGRATSPNLDSLAQRGLRFANAFAHAPSTRYSVPAILTGRYPSTIAWGSPASHWPPEVLPENRLVSEMLRERGYFTMALLSYHYFEPSWGLSQGFDDYDVHLMTLHSIGGDPAKTSGTSAKELADLAIERIKGRKGAKGPDGQEQPFFLWVHFYDPHYRYEVHPGTPVFGTGQSEIDLYDGEIHFTDQQIGRVLGALEAEDLAGRTTVLVTADHGEGFGEHNLPPDRRHGYHLYGNQTQVPLIVAGPGIQKGVESAAVSHVDIAPTLVQLAGGASQDEPQLLGRPLLFGKREPEATVFQEVMYEGPTVRKALVSASWHYIRNLIPDGTAELYDRRVDPGEERDLQGLPSQLGIEAELAKDLARHMDQMALPVDFEKKVAGNLSKTPIAVATPIGVRLGEFVEVVGSTVRTPVVRRGERVEIAVVLRILRKVPGSIRLFCHLRGPSGFVNADHEPLSGLLPLSSAKVGSYVQDVVQIPVPGYFAPGQLTLVLGLFSAAGRVPVSPPGDPVERLVRVGTVELR